MVIYIDIEGTDGCGKKTQTELLHKHLTNLGKKCLLISFPNYASPSSALVKMFLGGEFGTDANTIDAYQASAFYSVDRVATMAKINVNDYDYVIFDRYVPSNMIHQSARVKDKQELEELISWIHEFEFGKMRLPRPDKILFLDVPVEVSLKLANARADLKNGQAHDIFEEDKNHMYKAYENAKYVAEKFGWERIDCVENGKLKTIEEIHQDILTKLNV